MLHPFGMHVHHASKCVCLFLFTIIYAFLCVCVLSAMTSDMARADEGADSAGVASEAVGAAVGAVTAPALLMAPLMN